MRRGLSMAVIVLLTLTVWGCGGGGQREAAESAVDSFYLAIEATDQSAAAALFAVDGVFTDIGGGEWIGRDRVSDFVEQFGPAITRCVRVGTVEASQDGSFVFPVEFTYNSVDYERDVRLVIVDDLIIRHDWVIDR